MEINLRKYKPLCDEFLSKRSNFKYSIGGQKYFAIEDLRIFLSPHLDESDRKWVRWREERRNSARKNVTGKTQRKQSNDERRVLAERNIVSNLLKYYRNRMIVLKENHVMMFARFCLEGETPNPTSINVTKLIRQVFQTHGKSVNGRFELTRAKLYEIVLPQLEMATKEIVLKNALERMIKRLREIIETGQKLSYSHRSFAEVQAEIRARHQGDQVDP